MMVFGIIYLVSVLLMFVLIGIVLHIEGLSIKNLLGAIFLSILPAVNTFIFCVAIGAICSELDILDKHIKL